MKLENVLTDEQLQSIAPSIFATEAQEGASEIYQFLPTSSILEGMRDQGWVPVEAQEQRVQSFNPQQHRGYQKHMIRFARTRDLERMADKLEPGKHVVNRAKPLAVRLDILITNSHDRTSGYQLFGAPKRLICFNGLVISDNTMKHLSIRHVNFNPDKVVAASLGMAEALPMVLDVMQSWQDRILTDAEKAELAEQALKVRWINPAVAPIRSEMLLKPRRYEDNGNDLWSTWNVIQENLTKGGVKDQTKRAEAYAQLRRAPGKSRPVTAIDANLKLNQQLWDLADQFSQS